MRPSRSIARLAVLALAIGPVEASANGVGKSCQVAQLPQHREAINRAAYQIFIRDGGRWTPHGSAIAVDPRGYFITALHVVYRSETPGSLKVRRYGSQVGELTDRDICVVPIGAPYPENAPPSQRLAAIEKLDFAVLKADWRCDGKEASSPYAAIDALPLRIHTKDHIDPMRGLYVGFRSDARSLGQLIEISFPEQSDWKRNDPVKFRQGGRVENGHSGAAVANEAGVVFAVIHKNLAADANKPNLPQEDRVDLALSSEGNLLRRAAIRDRLLSIPASEPVARIIEASKTNDVSAQQVDAFAAFLPQATAIDSLHLIEAVKGGHLRPEEGGAERPAVKRSEELAYRHCLDDEHFDASHRYADRAPALKATLKDSFPTVPWPAPSVAAAPLSLVTALNKAVTRLSGPAKADPDNPFRHYSATDAVETGRKALNRARSATYLTQSQRDFSLLVAIESLTEAATRPAGAVRSMIAMDARANVRYRDYLQTDLALAMATAEQAHGLPPTASTLALITSPYGKTASAATILANNAKAVGVKEAEFNYTSYALAAHAASMQGQTDTPFGTTLKSSLNSLGAKLQIPFSAGLADPVGHGTLVSSYVYKSISPEAGLSTMAYDTEPKKLTSFNHFLTGVDPAAKPVNPAVLPVIAAFPNVFSDPALFKTAIKKHAINPNIWLRGTELVPAMHRG